MNAIIKPCDRLFTKLEMNNLGSSHKYRAACLIIEDALRKGSVIPGGTTVIEKTGGNFGFGLIAACHPYGIPIQIKHTEMLVAQEWFYRLTRIYMGYTAAACVSVAQRLVSLPEFADTTCVTIAYDAGFWYQN